MRVVVYCGRGGRIEETGDSDMPLRTVWADGTWASLSPKCTIEGSYRGLKLLDAHIELHARRFQS